jgi:glycosyltransferase involved in cell wall biosynthesis
MIVEAFACGVPVVGSDSGEIPFTIGDAGLVLPEKDDEAWINALTVLLASPERRQELSGRGRHRAESHFSWHVVAQRTLGFIAANTAS